MIEFFLDKINKQANKDTQRMRVGELAGRLGFISNILLFLGKFVIGITASSSPVT